MKVLITGAGGFVGKNLKLRLDCCEDIEVVSFTRSNTVKELCELVSCVDVIIHLAGVNRPKQQEEFESGNLGFTETLIDAVISSQKITPIIYTSSIQAESDNPYGRSKRLSEVRLLSLNEDFGNPVYIFRLPNVFGKFCRPDYNSVVATFCYRISRYLPIEITNEDAQVNLIYVDDLLDNLISLLDSITNSLISDGTPPESGFISLEPVYLKSVGSIADELYKFRESRKSLITQPVGSGFIRKLYSTYISYYSPNVFSYELTKHEDARGVFVEILKTKDSGQFSFFTAYPGVTRGGHYHHSKNEKFLVVKGNALFRFRNVATDEYFELFTSSELPKIVETVPGWAHDITNVGDQEMLVFLWANEIFNRDKPDTISFPMEMQ